ncbi:unnamed protein product [Leptidea sinapis]|uniref:FHF complex subunit HOOK-interacting protein C-terminal domain-containing protein n=1 Tax=Leptidea sinapis TaxID=189913 RepID=A0A5E4QHV4_9NEOP|nr:unnamed protein product [Leptidea sinapis]
MLSRFSDVLQSAADVLAPPASRFEDFEYHWKMVLNFYQNYDENSKVHIEDTRIPHHLHQMLQLIVDEEKDELDGTVGPCLEAVVQRTISVLDALTVLAVADRPPGARGMALSLTTALLRRTRRPCLNSAHVYRPIQRMLVQCSESAASPTEKEEVELLLTLCGLVRKESGLANIFTTPYIEDKSSLLSIPEDIQKLIPVHRKMSTPKKNPLFVDFSPPLKSVSIVRSDSASNSSLADDGSVKSQKTVYDDNDKFLLIDLLLSYLNSADDIASLVTGCSPACESIVDKLRDKYRAIPPDVDTADSSPPDVQRIVLTTALLAKCLRVIDSTDLINEFSNWLVGDGEVSEWPLLLMLIDNCLTQHHDLTLETLRMERLVISRVISRAYYAPHCDDGGASEVEERDRLNDMSFGRERERNSFLLLLPRAILSDPVGVDYENYIHDAQRHYQLWLDITASYRWSSEAQCVDNTASSTHSYDSRPEADLHQDVFDAFHRNADRKIENKFTVTEDCKLSTNNENFSCTSDTRLTNVNCEHTSDALNVNCQKSIESQNVKCQNNTDKPNVICHGTTEKQSTDDEFDEGPFLRMLFTLLSKMPDQPYQVNLHLTSIISKLALLPHPYLHEYLLNPSLPTAKKTRTLFKILQDVAKRLTMEIPRFKNYKKIIDNTRMQLMSEDPSYDDIGIHNQLVESLIVLEEFCKELAAIAFVKYQHSIQTHR